MILKSFNYTGNSIPCFKKFTDKSEAQSYWKEDQNRWLSTTLLSAGVGSAGSSVGIYVPRVWVSVSFQWGQWSWESSVTEPEAIACTDWSLLVSILMIWPKAYSLRTLATISYATVKLDPAFSQTAKVLTFKASYCGLLLRASLHTQPHKPSTSSTHC